MADNNGTGERPGLILGLNEVREKHRKVSREELDDDLTDLSTAILNRQAHTEKQLLQLSRTMVAHDLAIRILDARTLAGRIRQLQARIALWRETVRTWARRLGDEIDPPLAELAPQTAEALAAHDVASARVDSAVAELAAVVRDAKSPERKP